MNNPPRVNYPLPILITLVSTLIVIALFAVLTLSALTISVHQFTAPPDDPSSSGVIGGLCGLVGLVLLAAILFFLKALINGVRDLSQPLQRLSGWLDEKHVGRGGMGGNWLVVRLDEPPPPAAPSSAAWLEPVVAGSPAEPLPLSAGPRSGPAAQVAPPPATSFGAGLTEVQQKTRRTTPSAPAPAPAPPPPRRAPGTTRLFRVDKAVYNELRPGEPLTVAYSRFLEHVYYVEHQTSEAPAILYNKSLL